jgi:putative membrane protein
MELFLATVRLRPYVFAFLAAFVVAAGRDLGLARTLGFGVWVWALAWVAEFSSTRVGVPFGLYHYTGATRGHELYVANVPFMDSLSFTFLAYASFALARAALPRPGTRRTHLAGLAGALMMLLDVVIDPLAVRGDRWFLGRLFHYAEPGVYFGVPLANFAGWWLVGSVGVGGYLWVTGRAGAPRARLGPGIALYYAVLGFNLAVTAWIGEWTLLVAGLAWHGLAGAGLWALRRAGTPPRTQGCQSP